MSLNKEIENVKNEIIDNISTFNVTTSYAILRYIHDYLITNIIYILDENRTHIRTLYGALVEKQCVCEGYSEAFQYLAQQYGINCITARSLTHEWNFVEMKGKWYAVDVTYDDPLINGKNTPMGSKENLKIDFFLIGTENESVNCPKYSDDPNHTLIYSGFSDKELVSYPPIELTNYIPTESVTQKSIENISNEISTEVLSDELIEIPTIPTEIIKKLSTTIVELEPTTPMNETQKIVDTIIPTTSSFSPTIIQTTIPTIIPINISTTIPTTIPPKPTIPTTIPPKPTIPSTIPPKPIPPTTPSTIPPKPIPPTTPSTIPPKPIPSTTPSTIPPTTPSTIPPKPIPPTTPTIPIPPTIPPVPSHEPTPTIPSNPRTDIPTINPTIPQRTVPTPQPPHTWAPQPPHPIVTIPTTTIERNIPVPTTIIEEIPTTSQPNNTESKNYFTPQKNNGIKAGHIVGIVIACIFGVWASIAIFCIFFFKGAKAQISSESTIAALKSIEIS